jgi:hypothetical protein
MSILTAIAGGFWGALHFAPQGASFKNLRE